MEQSENNKKASSFRTYRRSQCAVFCKTKELYGGLSNMASGFPLEVNGIHIRTSEALYQACRFPHIPELQRLIIAQSSPMTAKMKGKPYRDRSRSDWDRVRVNIMRWCLRVKLICNWSKFGRLLLSTEERPIVEESRKDDFWGAKIGPDQTLLGINALGRLLMELRRDLATKPKEQLLILQPLDISDFCLYETPIRIVKSANVESAVVFNQSPIKEISSSQDWPVDDLRIVEPNGARPTPPRQPPRPTPPPPPTAEPLKWRKVRASRRVTCNHCLKPINYGEVCAYAGKTVLDVDRAIHEHCFRGVYEK